MKPCSATPSSPTHLRPGPERRSSGVGRAGAWAHAAPVWWAVALRVVTLLALPQVAAAHGGPEDSLPLSPGLRVGAGLVLGWTTSGEPWPEPRLQGVLQTGQSQEDQRHALVLQQAALDLGWRWTRHLGVQWRLSSHDGGEAHTDVARLEANTAVAGGELRARLGRQDVALGTLLDDAGTFDGFAQQPLAKSATLLDGSWTDDGLELQWRRPAERGVQAVALGVWRARAFPGGPQGPVAPSLRLEAGWGHLSAQLFGAWLQPQSRGAQAFSASGGHSHGVPDCSVSTLNRVCFDGRSRLLGLALGHDGGLDGRLRLRLAGMMRREDGTLSSTSAAAALRSRVSGVWADAFWRAPGAWGHWQLAGRLEQLVPRNTLQGANPAVLAEGAGLLASPTVRRQTLAVGYDGWRVLGRPGLVLWAELGRQQAGPETAQTWAGLRLLWQDAVLINAPGARAGDPGQGVTR